MDNYHFIGIKGSGMSALAQILHDLGYDGNISLTNELFSYRYTE